MQIDRTFFPSSPEPGTEISVGVARFAVGSGSSVLVTAGLGSCVAIILHDAAAMIGGLAHVLLPMESMAPSDLNPAKFASTAVPLLENEIRKSGSFGRPIAKIVGGASMFGTLLSRAGVNMGERNIEAVRRALRLANIPIVAEDVGGDYGRSVRYSPRDGTVVVTSLKRGTRVL